MMNIIIGLLLYIVIGCIVTKISRMTIFKNMDDDNDDEEDSIILGTFWPIILVILPLIVLWKVVHFVFIVVDIAIDVLCCPLNRIWQKTF